MKKKELEAHLFVCGHVHARKVRMSGTQASQTEHQEESEDPQDHSMNQKYEIVAEKETNQKKKGFLTQLAVPSVS